MNKILKPKTMQYFDNLEIQKVTSNFLMKRAAEEVSKKINDTKKRIIILVGSGNNGGDGIALASIIVKRKLKTYVIYVQEPKSESSIYFKNILEQEEKFTNFLSIDDITKDDLIIDAILGNGSRHNLKNNIEKVCKKLKELKPEIISIDIPTGLNSETGIADPNCIKADKTIAIQEYKSGHFLNDAKDYVGILEKVDIQIPNKEDFILLDDKDFKNFLEKRKNNSNKNTYKRVSIIGGSENFKGAPILSLLAITSLKCGSGLAMVCSIKEVTDIITKTSLDATTYTLKKKSKAIKFSKSDLDKIIKISNSIVIGPGLTKTKSTIKILKYLLENFDGYLIIDADAILIYKELKEILKQEEIKSKIILTPHIRELSRFLDCTEDYIKNNIIKIVENFVKNNDECLLLKGPTTIVANKESIYFVNNGSPAQAKAGNGDVLTGVIAAIVNNSSEELAKKVAFSSYICNLAASELKEIQGENSVLASEIAKYISKFNI